MGHRLRFGRAGDCEVGWVGFEGFMSNMPERQTERFVPTLAMGSYFILPEIGLPRSTMVICQPLPGFPALR